MYRYASISYFVLGVESSELVYLVSAGKCPVSRVWDGR